ncbi:type II toxin-antitoxin system VapC family toxin [Synechococcus sp. GFB01]|uniref:type II toxin-antitoxin system VapC family toxin n=1 Tax=Synechococcus sp. GFB01 TaxID=1662190 RepID=UPI00064E1F54|nr:PIN domain-containing protein [Synechococcus sp. GFB01]KMM16868.1 ribonuclease [Synechococcus sp. GFB01]
MILLDTSVWVEHLRSHLQTVADLLEQGDPLMHPWVIGELACGNMNQRVELLAFLGNLPSSVVARDAEILRTIDQQGLMGRGIGYVDAGLITSCLLSGCRFWTLDRRLAAVAASMDLAWGPPR